MKKSIDGQQAEAERITVMREFLTSDSLLPAAGKINSANINCDSRKRKSGLIVISGKWLVGLYTGLAEPQIMDLFQHIRPSFLDGVCNWKVNDRYHIHRKE